MLYTDTCNNNIYRPHVLPQVRVVMACVCVGDEGEADLCYVSLNINVGEKKLLKTVLGAFDIFSN